MTSPATTLVDVLKRHAAEKAEQVAVYSDRLALTYSQLWRDSLSARDWYLAMGFSPGQRAVLTASAPIELFAPSYIGLHLAGGIAVPVDSRLSADDAKRRAEIVGATLYVEADRWNELREAIADSGRSGGDLKGRTSVSGADVADILFTTGSTGDPKAVALTHSCLAFTAQMIGRVLKNGSSDIEVSALPFFHSFGLGRLRSVLWAGGAIAYAPGLVFPQVIVETVKKLGATGLSSVPAGIRLLRRHCREGLQEIGETIDYLEIGSAPMTAEEKRELMDVFPNANICMHYGLTEASRSSFLVFRRDVEKLESVGKASPGVSIDVLGDDGKPVPSGSIGRLRVQGPNTAAGYWGDDSRTDMTFDIDRNRIDTGDLGSMDSDGYIYLTGRADNIINCGGYKVIPEELERIVASHPAVSDAACTAIPDPDEVLGEIPCLHVVCDDTSLEAELRTHVLSNTGSPVSTVAIRFVEKIPRTESGKILRKELSHDAKDRH